MKNIVAFFQYMPPHGAAVSLRGWSLINNLSDICPDCIITVFSSNRESKVRGNTELIGLGALSNNKSSLIVRTLDEIRLGLRIIWKIFSGKKQQDVLLISSPSYLVALMLVFYARLARKNYIIDLRDIYPEGYVHAFLIQDRTILVRIFRYLSRQMYRNASLILCATNGLKNSVDRESGGANSTLYYNGFPEEFLDRISNKNKKFTVCFHGVLGFFQDIESIISIAAELEHENIDMVVIGYGRKDYLLKNNVPGNLRFEGRLDFRSTIREIEKCHIGLCLRHNDEISKDSFPVKVWEYLGLGIPVIITPPSEAGDFVIKNGCGFCFNSGDVLSIVEKILELKYSPEKLDGLSANCKSAASDFTREKLSRKAAQAIKGALYD